MTFIRIVATAIVIASVCGAVWISSLGDPTVIEHEGRKFVIVKFKERTR